MAKSTRRERPDWNGVIIDFLTKNGPASYGEIAAKIGMLAAEKRIACPAPSTIHERLNYLGKSGQINSPREGYAIRKGWKEGQPKAFILVELTHQKHRGENYQKSLADEIDGGFYAGRFKGLHLISVNVTMGAEFSLIVQVYSDDLHAIGKFVKGFLLTHELVSKTRTIMIWPTEPKATNPKPFPP